VRPSEDDEPYFRDPVCSLCGLSCTGKWYDEGIGPYEFWGMKGTDRRWEFLSDCCEAEIEENTEDEE
jgi:hypothetical protein